MGKPRKSKRGRIREGSSWYKWGPTHTHTLHLDTIMLLMAAGDEGLSRNDLKPHLAAAYGRSVSYHKVDRVVRDLRQGHNPLVIERPPGKPIPRVLTDHKVIATPAGETWARETLRRIARLNDKIVKGIVAPVAVPLRGGME